MLKLYKITFFNRFKERDVAHVHALTAVDALDSVKKQFRGALINSWKEVKVLYAKRQIGTVDEVQSQDPGQIVLANS